jgi:hypothetical protein
MRFLLVLFSIAALVGVAPAATIRVARDGSGDYSTIQAAVDAASAGDTISIGPGRYAERALVTTPGWSVPVYILIRQDRLSLIGSGDGQTIVGQAAPWDTSQPWSRGIEAGPNWGSNSVYVEGIQFENIAMAVGGNPAPNLEVASCRFVRNHWGVFSPGPVSTDVRNCEFLGLARDGRLLYSSGNATLLVKDCVFWLDETPRWSQMAVQLQGTASAVVEASSFVNGNHGLNVVGGGDVAIRGCSFGPQTYESIICDNGQAMEITGCGFSGSGYALAIDGIASTVSLSNSVVENATKGSVAIVAVSGLSISHCVLDRGSRYTIDQYVFCDKRTVGLPHIDARNNDWGTSDADSIAAAIHVCDYLVDFVPYVGQAVAAESKSWGELKALFR